uniref:Uncharacterized protein n=1 Tax=Trypanosoma vivax (strain Y486) TaxID=1055687 RepID=G0U3S7_TRYVY|nr:conserved hypothetical protein [Trypanosoma vivax Y486]
MAGRCPVRRDVARPLRANVFAAVRRRMPIYPLEAALMLGAPHPIVASLLCAANGLADHTHIGGCRRFHPVAFRAGLAKPSHSSAAGGGDDAVRRVLSCSTSRDILLSACLAAGTPVDLWPSAVKWHIQAPQNGCCAPLASAKWRAFLLVLVKGINNAMRLCGVPSLVPLCTVSLSPSIQAGNRVARIWISDQKGVMVTSFWDIAMAFAACCLMNDTDVARRDAAWMELWAFMESQASSVARVAVPKFPSDYGYSSWLHCQELRLGCLLRAGKHSEIEAMLAESKNASLILEHISDSTLTKIFLQASLSAVTRYRVLGSLLAVSRAKWYAAPIYHSQLKHSAHNLPAVACNIKLFGSVLHSLILQVSDSPSPENKARFLRDVAMLLRMCNVRSLAASLVPDHNTTHGNCDRASALAAVMKASPDGYRAKPLAYFVEAVREVVQLACRLSRQGDDAAVSVIHGSADVLSSLLSLCATRGTEPNCRKAQPEWRRRLQSDVAVRSHKYELLSSELPHSGLSRCVAMLLADGFVIAGGLLGSCLAAADFIDLRFYSLGLLSSLYHAVCVLQRHGGCGQPVDACRIVESLYFRRREVFGEDTHLRVDVEPTAAPHAMALVPHKTQASRIMAPLIYFTSLSDLGALNARSVVAAGGSLVVDRSVGVWLRKGTISTS